MFHIFFLILFGFPMFGFLQLKMVSPYTTSSALYIIQVFSWDSQCTFVASQSSMQFHTFPLLIFWCLSVCSILH
uniref:Uncharacterized protein n=1 Tax=Anopheles darlingi TaxID=43151 RepID=A0A2M4DAG3_ANODA